MSYYLFVKYRKKIKLKKCINKIIKITTNEKYLIHEMYDK